MFSYTLSSLRIVSLSNIVNENVWWIIDDIATWAAPPRQLQYPGEGGRQTRAKPEEK